MLYFVHLPDDWSVPLILLVEDLAVLEVVNKTLQSLESGVAQHANLNSKNSYFLASEFEPFFAMKLLVELFEVAGVDKVDEAVAYVALVLEVAWEVEEIVAVFENSINF